MFDVLITNILNKKRFVDPQLREDCYQGAFLDLLQYWKGFNPEMGTNCFAYYSSVCINGITKIFNKYRSKQSIVDVISLDNNIHSI